MSDSTLKRARSVSGTDDTSDAKRMKTCYFGAGTIHEASKYLKHYNSTFDDLVRDEKDSFAAHVIKEIQKASDAGEAMVRITDNIWWDSPNSLTSPQHAIRFREEVLGQLVELGWIMRRIEQTNGLDSQTWTLTPDPEYPPLHST